eukprot:GHVS01096838.1.p1 GENE.GHVS01096838.1~~GHVS01096838.1.p1  ORF type:complete len:668 (+),score=59.17 GHVS01096838.1:153-2156(+)
MMTKVGLPLLLSAVACALLVDGSIATADRKPNSSTERALPLLQKCTAVLIANEPVMDNKALAPLAHSLDAARVPAEHQFWLDHTMWGKQYGASSDHSQSSGLWSWLPWLKRIHDNAGQEISWFFMATAHTRIQPERLEAMVERANNQLSDEHRQMFKCAAAKDEGSPEKEGNRIFGVRLKDEKHRIIHHYFIDDNFGYPLISSGALIHRSVLSDLLETLKKSEVKPRIHIDAGHELFKLIYTKLQITVTDAEEFCVATTDFASGKEIYDGLKEKRPNAKCGMVSVLYDQMCSETASDLEDKMWLEKRPFCSCRRSAADQLAILIKTTEKHHETRVSQIRELWANELAMESGVCGDQPSKKVELVFLSDAEGSDIVDLAVANTERGHCAKFYAMLKYFHEKLPNKGYLFITDDDSLVNIQNLLSLVAMVECRSNSGLTTQLPLLTRAKACVDDPSKCHEAKMSDVQVNSVGPLKLIPLYLGERYGYAHWTSKRGYDFITGGGGMLLDKAAVNELMNCKQCRCSRPDEPDDMAVGRWMKSLGITARNYMGFHQASPQDYHEATLYVQRFTHPPISFHRFNINDPNVGKDRYATHLAEQATFPCQGVHRPVESLNQSEKEKQKKEEDISDILEKEDEAGKDETDEVETVPDELLETTVGSCNYQAQSFYQ